ncbi:MAG TPA: DUF1800 family protein [Thermoanaerobaculia bacterium]|jgi:uncharacterized protein (DUF1800 family)|nr:DUF1800 family protein [Thermoanaerobaculia bacterium]
MRRLGGAFVAALFTLAVPAQAQQVQKAQHVHSVVAPAAAVDTGTIVADAKTTVAAPAFSPAPGTLTAPNNRVTMTTATAGATIYYTTDGSSPSRKKSPVYTAPIAITATTTLKAFAYKKGMTASAVTTGVYTYNNAPPPPPPSETGGTLFVGTLTPQGAVSSNGSGSATLTLTQDQNYAFLRYSYANLTGPIISQHIHASDGTILFDLDTTAPQADGSRIWNIQPTGTYSKDAILAAMRGGQLYLNLHTAAYPAGEIKGFFRLTNGSQTFTPPPAPPALPGGPPTADDAARLLMQATYGARPGDVESVQAKQQLRAWLDEQMAMPPASHLAKYNELVAQLGTGQQPNPGLVLESFTQQAIQGNDQLRQRVVFALSEHFVISAKDADVRNFPEGMASCLDILGRYAFGNFRDLLEAVTLAPTMGVYLDMTGSTKTIPELGRNPNENYPREVLQLFTIGLYELWPDGTLKLDAQNQPIPTYDQDVVKAMARAFTGWTFGGQNQGNPQRFFRPTRNYLVPMEPWSIYHDTAEKVLLDGATLPAGQSATADLEGALDVIFNHPNVGPFVCKSLIQRLVTSNPSPAYVYRCGQVFDNNGAGVRGDLATVVRAILLDYEARSTSVAARQDAGHLREPVVRILGLLRAVDTEPRNGRWRLLNALGGQNGSSIGEVPLSSPTVFNFFEPGFALPGEIAQAGLVSPEFQIASETTIVNAANFVLSLLGNGSNGPLRFDLTPFQAPQVTSDAALLDKIDLLLFGGAMSDGTRTILTNALADPDFPHASPNQRTLTLLWLASMAPESVVQK